MQAQPRDSCPAEPVLRYPHCHSTPSWSRSKFCIETEVEKEEKRSFTMIVRQSSYHNLKSDKKSEWEPSTTESSLVETWYLHREAFKQIIRHTMRWQHSEKKQAVSQTYWSTRQAACWCQCTCCEMQLQRDTPRSCDTRANLKFRKRCREQDSHCECRTFSSSSRED